MYVWRQDLTRCNKWRTTVDGGDDARVKVQPFKRCLHVALLLPLFVLWCLRLEKISILIMCVNSRSYPACYDLFIKTWTKQTDWTNSSASWTLLLISWCCAHNYVIFYRYYLALHFFPQLWRFRKFQKHLKATIITKLKPIIKKIKDWP